MPKIIIDFKVSITKDEFFAICQKKLVTLPKCIVFINPESIIIKEEKTDFLKSTYTATANINYTDGLITINAKSAGIGPIQKKHVTEFAQIIKNTIERSINEKLTETIIPDDIVRCPKCGSTQIKLLLH